MLMMRLQRIGRKNNPTYRVIVTDSRNAAKRGNSIDLLGSYDPKAGKFLIDGEKAKQWIAKGVQVSDTVYNFLITEKILSGKKRNALSRKSPIVDEAKLKAEADTKAADKVNDEVREGDLGQEGKIAEAPAVEETPVVTEEVAVETPVEEEVVSVGEAPVTEEEAKVN